MHERLFADLQRIGLADWCTPLAPLLEERLATSAHGDMQRWQQCIASLPAIDARDAALDRDIVAVCGQALSGKDQQRIREALLPLSPWRKGPFDVGGVVVDSEWRSDLKWSRVANAVSPLAGRRILDVGSGNGYYALRMLGAGADCVIGVDPTLLFVMQFRALQHFLPDLPVHVLPLRSNELPHASMAFDTVFSMGVLYHQRSPLEHLRELRDQLKRGGELLLETLVLPGETAFARTPEDRYARMRNVWLLPSIAELTTWLLRSGFHNPRCADLTATTPREQRSTEWMTFESLREALDPADDQRTVEGWPAPLRAVLTATKP